MFSMLASLAHTSASLSLPTAPTECGTVRGSLSNGLPVFKSIPYAEAARWDAALRLPTVYDAAAAWRLPLAIVVAAAVAVVAVLVPPLCGAALVAARRRAEQRRKRELGKVS